MPRLKTHDYASLELIESKTRRRLWCTRFVLYIEQVCVAIWPGLLIIGLYLSSSASGIWMISPLWLHFLALCVFGAGVLWIGWTLFKLPWPTWYQAARRLETDSGLKHRPVSSLYETPASHLTDEDQKQLWLRHRTEQLASLQNLRLTRPRVALSAHDPFMLRGAAVLVMIVGVWGAWSHAPSNLVSTFIPMQGLVSFGTDKIRADIWFEAPEYTQYPPIQVDLTNTRPNQPVAVTVPEGSIMHVSVADLWWTPSLDGLAGEQAIFAKKTDGSYHTEVSLSEWEPHQRLELRSIFNPIATLDMTVAADAPPTVDLIRAPFQGRQNTTRLDYTLADDFGVTDLRISLYHGATGQTFAIPALLPTQNLRSFDGRIFQDFTPHPLAGENVELSLVAVDHLGQEGMSQPIPYTVPHRTFSNPIAAMLIETRKNLALELVTRSEAVDTLAAVQYAARSDETPLSAYIGIRVALQRLFSHDSTEPEVRQSTLDLLWHIALDLEDGGLAMALAELRAAQDALAEAIAQGADQTEIDALMERVKTAMDAYLRALAEAPSQQNQSVNTQNQQKLRTQDLNRLLERIAQLTKMGDTMGAQALLMELRQIMENINLQQRGIGAGPGEDDEDMLSTNELINSLDTLLKQQSDLVNESHRMNEYLSSGRLPTPQDTQSNQSSQSFVRQNLEATMDQLQSEGIEPSDALSQAIQKMRQAESSLGRQDVSSALEQQSHALQMLTEGMRQTMGELQKMMGDSAGNGQGDELTDPMGRPLENGSTGSGGMLSLPSKSDIQRTREILEDIQNRANDSRRAIDERLYLERLLERF